MRNAGERQDVSPPIIHVPRQATSNSLLSRDALADLHPDRGRFRSYLLAAARNFVCNEFDKQSATVRGGDVAMPEVHSPRAVDSLQFLSRFVHGTHWGELIAV
ncbi:MAG: hypothetical protein R3C17_14725 [Planctomycetaceae bacterium]